jgi:hypothetical protein
MTATVHHIRPVEPDALAELHAERERLSRELQRFVVVDERRNAADAKIGEVDAALGALDRADRQAIEAWAETAEGAAPEPLLAERKALLARRLDAEAERQAAEVAVAAVAGKRTALIHAMNAVGARIRERQVAAALEQARGLHAEVVTMAADVGARMMKIEALRQFLTEAQAEAANRRDEAQTATFRAALGEVGTLRAPDVLGDPATVAKYAAEWRGMLR